MEYTTLNNHIEMPLLGYGVFRIEESACRQCVEEALETGYRLIDTAEAYGNERAVGRAIRDSGIPREELFVVTKLRANGPDPMTRDSLCRSLELLDMPYVDLYLIHQPYGNVYGCYEAMEKLLEEGKTRAIGVSNFTNAQLADILTNHCVLPAVNQIEINPYCPKEECVSFMRRETVQPMAWAPLSQGGGGELFCQPFLQELAEKYGKSPAQIILRWHIQRRVTAIPKSVHKERMKENFQIFDFTLTEAEMRRIAGAEKKEWPNIQDDPEFVKRLCGQWRLKDYRKEA